MLPAQHYFLKIIPEEAGQYRAPFKEAGIRAELRPRFTDKALSSIVYAGYMMQTLMEHDSH